jgi:hypothetical protein
MAVRVGFSLGVIEPKKDEWTIAVGCAQQAHYDRTTIASGSSLSFKAVPRLTLTNAM